MPEITHRKPGMMDAVFLSDCLCEIIMDGVHMQREMLKWVIRLLGCNRVVAVSDGTPYSGFN
ncbi:N-acetylglucosamine-6-phosphate deacetylase, partial [Erysipelatoclostridium ramosum]|nr:N-acetylglucosamine-6-phosphate deacetylase [Thomasclavelia ramosa]